MFGRVSTVGLLVFVAACASARGGKPGVRVRVVNTGRYTLSVRTCAPGPCSELRRLRPGARTTFTFPWTGYPRHNVEGWDGRRMAIKVPVDFGGPGRQTVTLDPAHHPQESVR
jgi:hypothetical protein